MRVTFRACALNPKNKVLAAMPRRPLPEPLWPIRMGGPDSSLPLKRVTSSILSTGPMMKRVLEISLPDLDDEETAAQVGRNSYALYHAKKPAQALKADFFSRVQIRPRFRVSTTTHTYLDPASCFLLVSFFFLLSPNLSSHASLCPLAAVTNTVSSYAFQEPWP